MQRRSMAPTAMVPEFTRSTADGTKAVATAWKRRGQEDKRHIMDPRPPLILVGLALSGIVQLEAPTTADAIPAMSRQTGEPCSTCHDVIPRLNHTGQQFRANGFRLPAPNGQDLSRDETPIPRSNQLGIDAKPDPPDGSLQDHRERGDR